MNTDAICGAITALDDEISGLTSVRDRLRALLPKDAHAPVRASIAVEKARPVDVSPDAPRRTRVLAATPVEESARPRDIAAQLDEPQSYVHADIQTLQKKGHVERVGPGAYRRTEKGTEVLETVWSGASRRPLIDREDVTQAQREHA